MISFRKLAIGTTMALATALAAQTATAANACGVDRPIVFAEHSWGSSIFQVTLARHIVEKGYGCQTESISGATIPLLGGMMRGDIDVTMEVWPENTKETWLKGLANGTVKKVGVAFPDAIQGWYVPRYLVEGPNAKAPGLKSVADLPKYKKLFRDQEEPSKGRFYNGPLGWGAEKANTNKLKAYKLEEHYTNFRPGTGAALAAAIASAYERRKPILAYYWSPTWLMGKYDLVQLEEPAYDAKIWENLTTGKDLSKATAYPVCAAYVGVNTKFGKQAPVIVSFLGKYGITADTVSSSLAYMKAEKGRTHQDAVNNFLKTQEKVWTKWVPADVAAKIKASLK